MRILGALVALLLSACAAQAQCTVPNSFINGTIIDANQVNANFSAVTTCVNNIPTVSSVTNFGASPFAADNTAAFNSCLVAAAAAQGACAAGGARYIVLGNITIPGNTTLTCGDTFPDTQDTNLNRLGTLPAILLDSGHTISASGQSATIKNCLIERNGMTFPAVNSSAYAGIAVSDAGNAGMAVVNSEILGFDTGIFSTGARPFFSRVYMDGTGITKAVLEADIGGGDIGYIYDIKTQSIATGNYNISSCTGARRAGTGIRLTGIYFLGNLISQNFNVAQMDIENQEIGGNLWVDNVGPFCGYGTEIGVLLTSGGALSNASLNLNSVQTGLQLQGSNPRVASFFPSVFLDFIGQDGIVQAASPGGINATIGLLNTNPFAHNVTMTASISGTTLTITALTANEFVSVGDFILGTSVTTGAQVTTGTTCTPGTVPCTMTITCPGGCATVGSESMTIRNAVQRYAINVLDTSGGSTLSIQRAYLTAIQNGVAPYINAAAGSNNILGNQLMISQLQTDLGGSNPFGGGWIAGPGADSMLGFITSGLGTCTGLGTGTCAMEAGSTITRGSVLLSPTGSPSGIGAVPLFLPVPTSVSYICTANPTYGSAVWPAANIQIEESGSTGPTIVWTAAILAGSTYRIFYHCKP